MFVFSISVDVITQSIEHSVRNHKLDSKSAFDILSEMEVYVTDNLPDENNIEHSGYKIVSLARINGARSNIYKDLNRKGQFSKVDIKNKWGEIETMAKGEVGNIADRMFVITKVAEEMGNWDAERS